MKEASNRKQKHPRINLAFYDNNLDLVREAAWQHRMSITEYINHLIATKLAMPASKPTPQARWLARVSDQGNLPRYQCSNCGDYVQAGDDRNFCPSCGAKMTQ